MAGIETGRPQRLTKTADQQLEGAAARHSDWHSVYVCRHRGQPDIVAANDYVRTQENRADLWHAALGPLWCGWALHAAFLIGMLWGRLNEEGVSDEEEG
jgi:hypothetical protein